MFPVGEWLLHPLETKYQSNPELPAKIDGIIMLSGAEDSVSSGIWNQIEFDRAAERNIYFLQLMHRYPNAKFVFLGGGLEEHKKYTLDKCVAYVSGKIDLIVGADPRKPQFCCK